MCALKLLSSAVPKVTDKAFKRKYIALGRIVTQWREIMGEKMADHAQPLKIHYRKPKRKGDPARATLDITASSAQASLLIMQKGVILERINQIFGEALITDIRFVHQTTNVKNTKTKKKHHTPLTEDEKNSLSNMLDTVEDDELKNRLSSMGEALLKDRKQ
jgi:hypothetical protein